MAKSFDELLEFLISRIALTGQSGTLRYDLIVIRVKTSMVLLNNNIVGPKWRNNRHETQQGAILIDAD